MSERPAKFDAALRLSAHLRRCCAALADGESEAPSWSPAFWLGRFDADARWWVHPVLTEETREDCAALGADLPAGLEQQRPVGQLTTLIQAVEPWLREILASAPAANEEWTVEGSFEPTRYTGRFARLPGVFGPLDDSLPGVSLFLHGSLADHTATAFSDVDDFVVLRADAWREAETLRRVGTALARVARGYQDIDPFQHHGHWLVTEFDLLYYDEGFMPLNVLEGARRVTGESRIDVRRNPDTSGFGKNITSTLRTLRRRLGLIEKEGGMNAFRLKGLAGEIALLPAYVLQSHGERCSKSEAICRAAALYSPDALPALEWATRVRSEFEPLVKCARVDRLRRMAAWPCARRGQAEAVFKRWAPWVGAPHPLGPKARIVEAIRHFANESESLAKPSTP
jgi:hypothetical protein